MSRPGRAWRTACLGVPVLALVAGCASEQLDQAATEIARVTPTAAFEDRPRSELQLPVLPPDRETYQAVGFEDRAEWVAAALSIGEVRDRQPGTRIVSAPAVNVRSGPETGAQLIGELADGTVVYIQERQRGWARVTYEGPGQDKSGWVLRRYLVHPEDRSAATTNRVEFDVAEPGTYRLPRPRPNPRTAAPTDGPLGGLFDGRQGQFGAIATGIYTGPDRAAELGYANARKILASYPWLLDQRTAHLHPAVLADALKDVDAHAVLWGSLREGDETRPTVWPPLNIGNRYSAEEVARLKRDAVQVVSRSSLPHWAIMLSQLFRASPDSVNLYITSVPERAEIVHVPTGDSYGVTGTDLTVSRDTLAQLEVRMPGYEPCPVRLTGESRQDVFRCDLRPRPTGSTGRAEP